MFHSNTEQLISYWRTRRGAGVRRRAPASIWPISSTSRPRCSSWDGGRRANSIFVSLAASSPICTAAICATTSFWPCSGRPSARPCSWRLRLLRRKPQPLVIDCDARAHTGQSLRMEIMIAPLIGSDDQIDRFIGLYQPTTPVAALMGRPVESLPGAGRRRGRPGQPGPAQAARLAAVARPPHRLIEKTAARLRSSRRLKLKSVVEAGRPVRESCRRPFRRS